MHSEIKNEETTSVTKDQHPVFQITTVSKYLALSLFVLFPFIGGYIGYMYAPEKVVEVERVLVKEVESKEESIKENAHVFVSQAMWRWHVTVDNMNNLTIGPGSSIKMAMPEGWMISQTERSNPYSKTIRFIDPELSGKADTDTPVAHIGLLFPKDIEACADTAAYKNGALKISPVLSGDLFDVYDAGWSDGWAGLPSRELCIESRSKYGEIIEINLYPITDENKMMMEEMLDQIKLQ